MKTFWWNLQHFFMISLNNNIKPLPFHVIYFRSNCSGCCILKLMSIGWKKNCNTTMSKIWSGIPYNYTMEMF